MYEPLQPPRIPPHQTLALLTRLHTLYCSVPRGMELLDLGYQLVHNKEEKEDKVQHRVLVGEKDGLRDSRLEEVQVMRDSSML